MKILKKNKKPLIFIGLLALLFVIGGTLAYYYNEVTIPNRFKAMTYNVQIREEFNNDWGNKKVFFTNLEETNTPVVIRINYNEQWKNNNGNILNNKINGTNPVDKVWTNTFTNDFVLGNDGWYYYKKVLKPQTEIQVLESATLNTIVVNGASNKFDYLEGEYHLDFNFEAIQATPEAVSDIWNRTITINGDNVTWQ